MFSIRMPMVFWYVIGLSSFFIQNLLRCFQNLDQQESDEIKSAWAKIVKSNLDTEASRIFAGTFFESLKAMPDPEDFDEAVARLDADGDGKVSAPSVIAHPPEFTATLHLRTQVSLDDYWTYVFGISPSRTREAAEAEYNREMRNWSQADLDEIASMQRKLLSVLEK